MTAQAASWERMWFVGRLKICVSTVSDMSMLNVWLQFQNMKGADATLDLFPSLTAQKAQMFFFSEFGCLPSEESF